MRWLLSLLLSAGSVLAYYDAGTATLLGDPLHLSVEPTYSQHDPESTERIQIPKSLTTEVATITSKPNGGHEIFYSIYYMKTTDSEKAPTKIHKGIFKRGVFADEPQLPTCVPCDGYDRLTSTPIRITTGFSGKPSCSTIPYNVR